MVALSPRAVVVFTVAVIAWFLAGGSVDSSAEVTHRVDDVDAMAAAGTRSGGKNTGPLGPNALEGQRPLSEAYTVLPAETCPCRLPKHSGDPIDAHARRNDSATLLRTLVAAFAKRKGVATDNAQLRFLMVGDSLIRWSYAFLANRVVSDLGIRAKIEPTADDANNDTVDTLQLRGFEGKAYPYLSWPPSDVEIVVPSDSGARVTSSSRSPVRLRFEAEQYISYTKHWDAPGIATFAPTHIVIDRGAWDTTKLTENSPRRTLLSFGAALYALRKSFPSSVPIFVYGLHKLHAKKSKSCDGSLYRDAIYCGVRWAKRELLSDAFNATAEGTKDLPRQLADSIFYLDTFWATAGTTKSDTHLSDGIHFDGVAMERIVDEILHAMVVAEKHGADSHVPKEDVATSVLLPATPLPPCEIGDPVAKSPCTNFMRKIRDMMLREVATSSNAAAKALHRSEIIAANISSELRRKSANPFHFGTSEAQRALSTAAVLCSRFLFDLRATIGTILEATPLPSGLALSFNPSVRKATAVLHSISRAALSATHSERMQRCTALLDANVTDAFFHDIVLPLTTPSSRYYCHDAMFIAGFQSQEARSHIVPTDTEMNNCFRANYQRETEWRLAVEQSFDTLRNSDNSTTPFHQCPRFVTATLAMGPAFAVVPLDEDYIYESNATTAGVVLEWCFRMMTELTLKRPDLFLNKRALDWSPKNCPGLLAMRAYVAGRKPPPPKSALKSHPEWKRALSASARRSIDIIESLVATNKCETLQ